ncbi:hypothetical protein FRB91_002859 [Serendipita sp. 411]|nr:hypothetical protein FRB91_002859 [Serendipita sp. 411]
MATPYEKAPHTASAYNNTFSNTDIEIQSPKAESSYFDEKDDAHDRNVPSFGRKTPTRKYSARWWKRTWDGAVRIGTWPRLIYCCIGFVLMILWLGVMLIFVGNEVKYEQQNARDTIQRHRTGDSNGESISGSILLKGTLVNFDAGKRSLSVSWSGLYKQDNYSTIVDLADPLEVNSTTYPDGIGIYRDVTATPYEYNYTYPELLENGTETTQTSKSWMYRVDNDTLKPVGVIGRHQWDSFDTEISFTQKYSKNVWSQPMLGYPFDKWQGQIVFVANDIWWATTDNVTNGDVFPLAGIQLADSTLNWRISYTFNNTCPSPSALDYEHGEAWPAYCYLDIHFDAVRPPLVIFAAVTAVVVNWTCTLFIFILTSEAIIMRRGYMLEGTDILSMCFTALFALPTIRSLLPGAPDYGAIIDLCGVLPCTLIVALCTVCVAVAKLNKRKREGKTD